MSNDQTSSKLGSMIEITRVLDGFTMGLGMVVGAIVAGSLEIEIPIQFYIVLFISGFFVTAHTMVINDIIDIEIDKINVPHRVLPSGRLSIVEAYLYSLFLGILGILGFALIDRQNYVSENWTWLFVLFHIVLSDLYSWKLKKTGLLGNIIVAYMSYALFLFSDYFVNGHLTPLPSILGVMAFLISLSREVLKGIMDTEGDSKHGIKTLAVIKGENFARFFAVGLEIACLLIGILLIWQVNWIGWIGIVIFGLMMSNAIYLSMKTIDIRTAKKAKTFLLYIPLAYAPFIIANQISMV